MDAYMEALEATVKQAARRQHHQRPKTQPRRSLLRLAMCSTAALTVAAIGLTALLQSGKDGVAQAAALPAFSRPAIDIAARVSKLPPGMSTGFDLRHARSFATSKGAGYIVASSDGVSVCMVVPDPPAGYGSTCAATKAVLRRGLVGERVAPAPDAGHTEIVVLQAAAAAAPVLRDSTGQTEELDVQDGVATTMVTQPGELTIAGSDGSQRIIAVRPFEPQGAIWVDCPDGRHIKVKSWRDSGADRRDAVCGEG